MNSFDIAFNYVIENEGGLIDNPNDPGGITKYGISLRFLKSIPLDILKSFGIYSAESDDISNLTIPQAKSLYKYSFWDIAKFTDITNQDCVNYIFDMAVNMGINPAIKCAQRACWSFMGKKGIIDDDGILGKKSIEMINHCGRYLLPSIRSERAGYYRVLIAERNNLKEFINGWLNRAYGK